jgi:CheY-like chemotaxis protein
MAQLLLIDDDPGTLFAFGQILRMAGHALMTASSGRQGLDVAREAAVDLILTDLRLPDMSGLEVLQHVRSWQMPVKFVVVTAFGNAQQVVAAMHLGAADFLEKPVFEEDLLLSVHRVLSNGHGDYPLRPADDRLDHLADLDRLAQRDRLADHADLDDLDRLVWPGAASDRLDSLDGLDNHESHAAARWARALIPAIESAADPRTIADWSRLAFVSAGALRNWCRTAGLSPRCSLVFARLLRAVRLGRDGKHKPEDVLDIMDRRTLVGLLKLAGLDPRHTLPDSIDTFLQHQTLVRDPDTLIEVKRALQARRAPSR